MPGIEKYVADEEDDTTGGAVKDDATGDDVEDNTGKELEDTKAPETGDTNMIMLWAVICMFALAGIYLTKIVVRN